MSLRATTSTWLLPRKTRKLWGPRRDTFTVYLRPAGRDSAHQASRDQASAMPRIHLPGIWLNRRTLHQGVSTTAVLCRPRPGQCGLDLTALSSPLNLPYQPSDCLISGVRAL